jgi:hypothetical protein
MYAYGSVIIERPGVMMLPESALMHVGEKTICWHYEDGHARPMEVRTGLSDGRQSIEVTSRQLPQAAFVPFDGTEQVILGDLTLLTDGSPVTVAPATAETKAASEAPHRRPSNTLPKVTPPRARPSSPVNMTKPVASSAGGR